MMKKLLALLLALAMLLSLAACGGDEKPTETEPKDEPTKESSQDSESTEPSQPDAPAANTETLEANLWTLTYDPEVWYFAEDDLYTDEEWSKIILMIPNEEDPEYYDVNVEIRACIESPQNFRDYLNSYGFDAYEYAENNAYDFTPVGGVDCLRQEGNYWGSPCLRYFARVEGAGATVFVEIVGEYEDERVQQLLDGLTFKLTDIGNVDGPWEWEGQPFVGEAHAITLGDMTLRSEWIPFEGGLVTDETFDHDIAVTGNRAYVTSDGQLLRYAYNGTELTLDIPPIETGSEYLYVQADQNGLVWLSDFMEPLTAVQDDTVIAAYDDMDYVAMHPSGTWGINWFSDPECARITIAQDGIATEPITFAEVDSLNLVLIDEEYIYVCGSDADWNNRIWVYDLEGNLQTVLSDEEGESLGSISFVCQTSNGFLALDGNLREIVFWDQQGTHLGTVDDTEIFGTVYPWFCSATLLEDGSLLVLMTEDRADESAMELIVFKLTGF
ncbi:MAG: hypothetical protein IJ453_00920 [Oscillospiraceae bacterium]|nr:hypothetical protein [Oscillospiraceae bacterium]